MRAEADVDLRGIASIPDDAPLKVALAPVPAEPEAPREPCAWCGSRGFNVHQRQWKAVKDLQVARVIVVRYRCKRCGRTVRSYAPGVGPGRQTVAVRQACIFLYCLGLPYQHVATLLRDLSCALSATTVRDNVSDAIARCGEELRAGRLRLARHGPGVVAGPEGSFAVRVAGPSWTDRWLEISVDPGPWASEIRSRAALCARWAEDILEADLFPPGSV